MEKLNQLFNFLFGKPKPKTLGDALNEAKIHFALIEKSKEKTPNEMIEHLQNVVRGHKASFTKLKKTIKI